MDRLTLTAGAFCLLISVAQPQDFTILTENRQINVAEGGYAFFSVEPSAEVMFGSWEFRKTVIAQWAGAAFSLNVDYRERTDLFLPSGSLLLKSVRVSDSGDYTVNMFTEGGSETSAILTLHVLAQPQDFTILTENRQINVAEGGNAFFSVKPSAAAGGGGWDYKNTTTTTNIDIVVWIGSTIGFRSNYGERAELFLANGSLLLKSVRVSDSGDYTVNMSPTGGGTDVLATLTLHVLEPVSKPNVTASVTNPVELNDTVVLTCFASGTAISYQWLQDNNAINPGDRFDLSGDNSNLTISGVLRSDGGFTCYAFNSISAMTSDPYHLNVSYGPDPPNISINPNLSTYLSGRTVTFSCFADSNPPAELEWNLNNTSLQQKGQRLIIDSITLNSTGNYTCQAFNNLTKRYSASTKQIVVIEPVSNVSVLTNNSKPMENMDTVFLTCHASGLILSRIWYKDDQVIKDNDRIITSPDNVTLTIISVNRYDSGTYKCKASNDFNNKSGNTKLQVNYGPEDINITPPGPVQIEQGETLTLSCAASSVPPATYEWYNGSRLLKTEQTYNIESMNLNAGGSYTCRASNSITDKSTNTTIQITVQVSDQPSSIKLSKGVIAAIVIVALLILGLISGISAWLIKKKACGPF
ncbi:carcinoembryonic antigen-related cell adhesion molecule 1-like isoform X3 [Scyliorhinus canicula]|uniref:carcinoembryonic antigen-related cell adhesion molecule 1-like isoform X3 n=1 Tax=Scyliorhinus canicula TaxID=7830 RepID=UPI0018F63E0E|nr:carcinoembryonic antigen-related cell adhesion molecule 1-like isoform X3 [Scyliorhinus canicula]